MKSTFFSIGMCAGLLILAACGSLTSLQGGGSDLTGQVWSLSSLAGQQLAPDSSITILFTADGKVGGSAGCNQYSGSYKSSGNKVEITSPLASTMMACDQAIMDQEAAYLKTLSEIKYFTIAGGELTLKNADNQNPLVYKAQSQDLAGTSWVVTGYNNGKGAVTSVLGGTVLTAEFGKDGVVSGNGGCNNYNGSYTVTGNQIKIGPLANTRMACDQPIMDQETAFLAAMQSAATYKIEGSTLELRTKDGALAVNLRKP